MPKRPDIETNLLYKKFIEINKEKKGKNKEINQKQVFLSPSTKNDRRKKTAAKAAVLIVSLIV
jgi:hypothetical protein